MQEVSQSGFSPDDVYKRASAPLEIDLQAIVGRFIASKWLIIGITGLFVLAGVFYAFTAAPVYRAQALIQIEDKEGGVPGLDEVSGLLTVESEAVTEIELLMSRMVLGETVDRLQLNIMKEPDYFPIIGAAIAKRFSGKEGELAETLIEGYAWGGEQLEFAELNVPDSMVGETLVLRAESAGAYSLLYKDEVILRGTVGERIESDGVSIQVSSLLARPQTRFTVIKAGRLQTIDTLSKLLVVTEKGRQSGILSVHLDGTQPSLVESVLDDVVSTYVRKNVDRNAEEVTQSLDFLKEQLPLVENQLERAEEVMNDYQVNAESVDILAETESLLGQIVSLEEQISELQLREVEVKRLYRPDHPTYRALVDQMRELRDRREQFQNQIKKLPETQQRLLRLRRDVEVNTQIYTQLLNNIQELDILRAGTIGNVRVVDAAEVNTYDPVAPRKGLIVAFAGVLGVMVSLTVVLFQVFLYRGLENPEEIERMGLPVYAAIPFSEEQEALDKLKDASPGDDSKILALATPEDLAVEAIRSLRTSIHFAMVEARNNLMMITGPSPFVGKSFVSSNLAVTVAMAGKKVLMIDADMRKGYLHKLFDIENQHGLSDYLSNQIDLAEMMHATQQEGLTLITRGSLPPNPSELLMTERFENLVNTLSETYDMVIIDTPPVLAVTDATIVGRYVGTTMLVVRHQHNNLQEIEVSTRRLMQNGIAVKGCIFNAIKQVHGYGYGAGYGYHTYEYRQS